MALVTGHRLGPYEIIGPLGMGGMGEVFKARDTRLDRVVAIKVLSSELALRPEFRQRFEREAKAISSLNHPHICALYDVGQQDGCDYIVMEFVEGEPLSARVLRGSVPIKELLGYAIEIADALDKAHRQGVVHRDLKPGNIMLTRSGTKLLDFGLAKMRVTEPAVAGLSAAATQRQSLTSEGTILGTYQYMAPEQLEGKEADARSDIFAFGAVLYEMLAGRKAFEGKTQASVIAKILESQPAPLSSVQPLTPPALARVIEICLDKDPENRWQTAHDLKLQLSWIADAGSVAGVPAQIRTRRRTREKLWIGTTAALAAIALASTTLLLRTAWAPASAAPLARFHLDPPEGTDLAPGNAAPQLALSPDGRALAFAAADFGGATRIWIRPLDALSARALDRTEDGIFPFWSPDGQTLGFFAGGKLKRISAQGGTPQTLCDAPAGEGGTWNQTDTIVFAPTAESPLMLVSAAAGATPSPVTVLDKAQEQISHQWPQFLPDGRHFIFLARSSSPEKSGIYISSLDSPTARLLLKSELRAVFAPPNYLLFVREGTLMAQTIDMRRFELTGTPVAVTDDVNHLLATGRTAFTVSNNGILVHRTGGGWITTQLTWFDRSGQQIRLLTEPGYYSGVALAPDGKRVAVQRYDPGTQTGGIWFVDTNSGTLSPFTFHASDGSPIWSPDGTHLAFTARREQFFGIYRKLISGLGSDELLLRSDFLLWCHDWSRDGQYIIYAILDPKTRTDLWALPFSGDKKPFPLLQGPFDEDRGRVSPDGHWLAYVSNETGGRREIYIDSFPPRGLKRRISQNGGLEPIWNSNGNELFFLAPGNQLMSVSIQPGETLQIGTPKPQPFASPIVRTDSQFVISNDGQGFLGNVSTQGTDGFPMAVILNWTAALQKKQR